MKRVTTAIVFALVVFASAVPVGADVIEPGTVEVMPGLSFNYGSYSADNGYDASITQIQIATGIGYFFTQLVELQVAILLDYISVDPGYGGSYDATDAGSSALVLFNFPTESSTVPFLGAGISFVGHGGRLNDGSEATVGAPRAVAGIRFLVGNSASINMGLSYEHQLNAQGYKDVSGNVFMVTVGMSVFVQSDRGE